MLGIFKSLISAKKTLLVGSLVFTVGIGVGVYLTNKLYTVIKVTALENELKRQDILNKKTIVNLKKFYIGKVNTAKSRVVIKKVKDYVKDNRDCDINDDTEQLLDISRTGMSDATRRSDERISRLASITQRQQIESCARDGVQYQELKLHYDALKQFIIDSRDN